MTTTGKVLICECGTAVPAPTDQDVACSNCEAEWTAEEANDLIEGTFAYFDDVRRSGEVSLTKLSLQIADEFELDKAIADAWVILWQDGRTVAAQDNRMRTEIFKYLTKVYNSDEPYPKRLDYYLVVNYGMDAQSANMWVARWEAAQAEAQEEANLIERTHKKRDDVFGQTPMLATPWFICIASLPKTGYTCGASIPINENRDMVCTGCTTHWTIEDMESIRSTIFEFFQSRRVNNEDMYDADDALAEEYDIRDRVALSWLMRWRFEYTPHN